MKSISIRMVGVALLLVVGGIEAMPPKKQRLQKGFQPLPVVSTAPQQPPATQQPPPAVQPPPVIQQPLPVLVTVPPLLGQWQQLVIVPSVRPSVIPTLPPLPAAPGTPLIMDVQELALLCAALATEPGL